MTPEQLPPAEPFEFTSRNLDKLRHGTLNIWAPVEDNMVQVELDGPRHFCELILIRGFGIARMRRADGELFQAAYLKHIVGEPPGRRLSIVPMPVLEEPVPELTFRKRWPEHRPSVWYPTGEGVRVAYEEGLVGLADALGEYGREKQRKLKWGRRPPR
jgi:hypothetical protein